MVIKNIEFYDNEIERLKTAIRRLRAEKRVAILIKHERSINQQNIEKAAEMQTDGR